MTSGDEVLVLLRGATVRKRFYLCSCVLSQREDERRCIRGPGEDGVPLPGPGGGGGGAVRPSQALHQPPAGAVPPLHRHHLPQRGRAALARHLPGLHGTDAAAGHRCGDDALRRLQRKTCEFTS